jgi:hypothetical protein
MRTSFDGRQDKAEPRPFVCPGDALRNAIERSHLYEEPASFLRQTRWLRQLGQRESRNGSPLAEAERQAA